MTDLILRYRECGAECREDWLRQVAHDNGLPLACVRTIADRLGEREDFGALILICETRQFRGVAKGRRWEAIGSPEMILDATREKNFRYLQSYLGPIGRQTRERRWP